MKAGLFAFAMLLMTAGASHAGGLVTKHSASVQLNVDAASATATRICKFVQYLSGVTMDIDTTDGSTAADLVVGGLGTLTDGSAAGTIRNCILKILLEQHLVSVNLTHR